MGIAKTKEKELEKRLSKMQRQLLKQNETLLAQVENKTAELVKSERLATIGTMASRIAHDLKQPLTIMQTYADMLTPEIISKLDYKGKEKWFRIQNAILDMNRIIEDVLDFARTTEIKKEKEPEKYLPKAQKQLIKQNETLLAQVENKTAELVKSERLATIGTMASRIAHDLKQPLTIMQTYADMLTPEIISKLDYKDKEKWFRLQNAILDMSRIIEDVLDFARTTEIKKKKSSFLRILRLAINHVKHPYGIIINLPENDVSFRCDSRKIEGVMSNLINNAVQAIDGQGEIDVTMSADSKFVKIKVRDSGSGIDKENLEKIFEPMFTTKKSGTGLGLVICKSIVEQHGGSISVSNKPTTFTIKLPI